MRLVRLPYTLDLLGSCVMKIQTAHKLLPMSYTATLRRKEMPRSVCEGVLIDSSLTSRTCGKTWCSSFPEVGHMNPHICESSGIYSC